MKCPDHKFKYDMDVELEWNALLREWNCVCGYRIKVDEVEELLK